MMSHTEQPPISLNDVCRDVYNNVQEIINKLNTMFDSNFSEYNYDFYENYNLDSEQNWQDNYQYEDANEINTRSEVFLHRLESQQPDINSILMNRANVEQPDYNVMQPANTTAGKFEHPNIDGNKNQIPSSFSTYENSLIQNIPEQTTRPDTIFLDQLLPEPLIQAQSPYATKLYTIVEELEPTDDAPKPKLIGETLVEIDKTEKLTQQLIIDDNKNQILSSSATPKNSIIENISEQTTRANTIFWGQPQPDSLTETQFPSELMIRTVKLKSPCKTIFFTAREQISGILFGSFKLIFLFLHYGPMNEYFGEKEFTTLNFLARERNWKKRKRKRAMSHLGHLPQFARNSQIHHFLNGHLFKRIATKAVFLSTFLL